MNQILHIFQKDTRRFWPEILTSILITGLFVLHYPSVWRSYADPARRQMLLQITNALGILTPVGWWLVIARATHAEALVGDSEFWLTRPYEWKKLLAAKVLFFAAWIGLPYLIAQSYLLDEAGFHSFSYLPGLFLNLVLISISLLLPLFSIATVTSNFARMTLTVLGVLVLFTGYMFLINTSRGYTPAPPNQNPFIYPLLFCGCIAAIVLQYATRRVWLSRALLIAFPIVIALTVSIYRSQAMVDRSYPQPASPSTAAMSAFLEPDSHVPVKARSWEREDYIDLPIRYSGVAEGYAVFADNFKFSLTAADGSQWTSPWQQLHEHNLPGDHHSFLSLMLDPAVFDRFKSAPVTLHITFAVSRYQSDIVTNMAYPSGNTEVPGVGFCSPAQFRNPPSLSCRSALQRPRLTHTTALWSNLPCSDSPPPPEATAQGEGWIEPDGPDFAMTSVWAIPLWFSNDKAGTDEYTRHPHWHLCPGTPLTLTQYHLVDRTQTDLTVPDFQFPTKLTQTGD